MKTTIQSAAMIVSFLSLAGAASAQSNYVGPPPATPVNSITTAGYGGGYGANHHSSGFEEGVYRGEADVNRSLGEGNYFNSLARVNNQEALARHLANKELRTETYFKMRQVNQAARDAQRPDPLSPEQYAVLAKKQAPDRLGANQYDRVLGRLNWPEQLLADQYAEDRASLEKLFAGRAATDAGVGTGFHADVRQIAAVMQSKLQSNLQTMTPMEFIAAKKFISGLSYEAQQPFIVEAVAAR